MTDDLPQQYRVLRSIARYKQITTEAVAIFHLIATLVCDSQNLIYCVGGLSTCFRMIILFKLLKLLFRVIELAKLGQTDRRIGRSY